MSIPKPAPTHYRQSLRKLLANSRVWLASALLSWQLAGCGSVAPLTTPDNTLDVSRYFPASLLAEPIKLRAGFTHTTQPFEVTDPGAVWEVTVGFVRRDEKLPVMRFMCSVTSKRDKSAQNYNQCMGDEPSIHMRWELMRMDGTVAASDTYDALERDATGQSRLAAYLVGLGGFTNQPISAYRLRVVVLRDFPELDITTPHIVIGRPFFRKR